MKFVVTAPQGAQLKPFVDKAVRQAADLLEIRSDLPVVVAPEYLSRIPIPLLFALRDTAAFESSFMPVARYLDVDIELLDLGSRPPSDKLIISLHSNESLLVEAILKRFNGLEATGVKYVEPMAEEPARQIQRLQRLAVELRKQFKLVTVLAVGEGAEEMRRTLSTNNDFHYCALDEASRAAPGQGILLAERERLVGSGDENDG